MSDDLPKYWPWGVFGGGFRRVEVEVYPKSHHSWPWASFDWVALEEGRLLVGKAMR